jgi:hypothetical protein
MRGGKGDIWFYDLLFVIWEKAMKGFVPSPPFKGRHRKGSCWERERGWPCGAILPAACSGTRIHKHRKSLSSNVLNCTESTKIDQTKEV